MKRNHYLSLVFLFSCLLLASLTAVANAAAPAKGKEVTINAHDGTELIIHQYPADGEYLVLWVVSSYGIQDRILSLFRKLNKNHVEVWYVDFAENLFQPGSSNLMRNLDARYVSNIVSEAHKRSGKKIILMARAYGAIPALRGATLWHQDNPNKDYLAGMVLFSPDLYQSIPELGLDPEYVPVIRSSSIPMMIYQASERGTGWQLPRLLDALWSHNPSVYYRYLPNVSGIFFESDVSPATQKEYDALPTNLPVVFRLLEKSKKPAPDKSYAYRPSNTIALMDSKLKPYKGEPVAKPIRLHDINGKLIKLNDYTGKVTLVNFWATWCPPCVHEIPSLNNLKSRMQGKNFQLISINYAESPATVEKFLDQVDVHFPVLMDVDSKVSAQWNVIAFPSTFVVGSDGKIHYGVNAAIEWDAPEVIQTLESLQ